MLQQEHETQPELPASQVRVTPEEMAKALAALEARKQKEAQRNAETLTLGQAVQDLALDATPEELLAEVQRQRAEKANARAAAEQKEREKADAFQEAEERRQAALRMAQPPQSPAQRSAGWTGSWQGSRNQTKRKGVIGILVACVLLPHFFSSALSSLPRLAGLPHYTFHMSSPTSHVAPAPHGTVESLASLPEGMSATCDTNTLWAIKQGKSTSAISVSTGVSIPHDANGNKWEIVKHNGQVYVRVYCLSEDALKTGSAIHLYNGNNVDILDGKVAQGQTVRLDKLDWNGKAVHGDGWEQLTTSFIPIDGYADSDEN